MSKFKIINRLIHLECFKEGTFILKSGKESNYYIDLRILVSYPELLKSICKLLYKKIEHINATLCGLPYAGIPYSQAMSILFNRPMILLRKERKKHGTSKMVEGISEGKDLIIIDDILTSGSSIIESLQHLNHFNIKKILVVVDRNEGGRERLEKLGFEVESLFSINDFIHLSKKHFINNVRNNINKKKSNICVSLDYKSTNQILKALDILKNNIVMVKIHCDIIEDYNEDFIINLTEICKKYSIYIIEDRKFSDIGNTFKNQFIGGIFKIRDWANFVTFHGIVGEGQISQFNMLRYRNQYGLLVANMSNSGNLLDASYTKKVIDIANNNDNSILGMISQKSLGNSNYLYFTPGIKLEETVDIYDQKYVTPKTAMENGSDILIVGRGITNSDNLLETCKKYQIEGWKYYKQNHLYPHNV